MFDDAEAATEKTPRPPKLSLRIKTTHLPTKFSYLPNLHIFITSSQFNVLAVLAVHPSSLNVVVYVFLQTKRPGPSSSITRTKTANFLYGKEA